MKTLDVTDWRTPLTGHEARVGRARLKKARYPRGVYRLEGTRVDGYDGYEYYEAKRALQVTVLERLDENDRWQEWMVDDPLHWYAMRQLVDALPPGRLVCAGLGLGLMLHHLQARRPDITWTKVYEIDPDVIELIYPTLPQTRTVPGGRANYYEIIEGDYYEWAEREAKAYRPWPTTILWDLAVGGGEPVQAAMRKALETAPRGVPVYRFGVRGPLRETGVIKVPDTC